VSREQLFAAFFFAVLLFLLYQAYLFLAPFAMPLFWAAILALTFYPLTARVVRLVGGRRGLAALLLVLAVTLLAVLPALYLGSRVVGEATDAYGRLHEKISQGEVDQLVAQLRTSPIGGLYDRAAPLLAQFSIRVSDILLRATNWLSSQMVSYATGFARNVLLSLVNLTLMLVALFFFFRDGEAMANGLRDLLPMEPEHKDAVFARLYSTLTAVVQGMIATALVQGLLGGIGYKIAGLSFSLFLGFVTGLTSFVPLAGPAIVWGGAAGYLALAGSPGSALFLALWGALLVSTADNWIKPLVIGGRAKLPTFPLLLSILGGLAVYGFLGVFLGPVVLATLLEFFQIYREEYRGEPAPHPAPLPAPPPQPGPR
jgi:predicted PurR-regulated permease PerM